MQGPDAAPGTQLIFRTSGLQPNLLAARTPPACRPQYQSLTWFRRGPRLQTAIDLDQNMLSQARSLLPCFCARVDGDYGYQFHLTYQVYGQSGQHSCWLAPIGASPPQGQTAATNSDKMAAVTDQIDFFLINQKLERATLTLELWSPQPQTAMRAPALLSLSINSDSPPPPAAIPDRHWDLAVPAFSQMQVHPELGKRLCSPTCVSMVLAHYGIAATPMAVAHQAHHTPSDMYGVWPANIWAASRWGLLGYLMRLPDWSSARWLLERRQALIVSVRYERGQLEGAAVPRTSGHLIVLKGYDRQWALVNDPAAATAAAVTRAYPLAPFLKTWLHTSGVAYVILPPASY